VRLGGAHAWRQFVLVERRRRGHLALLCAVLTATVVGYLMVQQRTVRVMADGREVQIRTRHSHDPAVLSAAGIDVRKGDRVTALRGDDTDVLRIDRAREVTLDVDGHRYRLLTHAQTVEQVLNEAGVALGPRDSVWQDAALVSMTAPIDPPRSVEIALRDSVLAAPVREIRSLRVGRALPVTLVENGRELRSSTSRPTVGQALREAGLLLGPGDRVTPGVDERVETGARIEIAHAMAVTIALPDEDESLFTFARTVGELLEEAGVTLGEGAVVVPDVDAQITPGLAVRIVVLSASNEIEREFIESRTVYRTDPDLDFGQTRTEPGHDGALVRRYAVSYANGVEAGRDLVEEYYDPEPLETVVYYPPQRNAGADAPSEGEIARVINVYATYYTPASSGRPPGDPNYGRTATGVLVTYGVVAVDPNVIPLGTRMFIPGYGYAIAADTGGAVKGYIIDLGYPDGVAVDWRSRWLDIYILS
jgi:uncharacterized protein YabE (DUF348 family)/3D (Asp-Asp-Asp) domain-containing protein